jgi:eukaryotic-like serine/threonine-protein kinase
MRARQVSPFCTADGLDADPDAATPCLVSSTSTVPTSSRSSGAAGSLTVGALHGIALGVTTALAAIHDAGGVHRDLKPANFRIS